MAKTTTESLLVSTGSTINEQVKKSSPLASYCHRCQQQIAPIKTCICLSSGGGSPAGSGSSSSSMPGDESTNTDNFNKVFTIPELLSKTISYFFKSIRLENDKDLISILHLDNRSYSLEELLEKILLITQEQGVLTMRPYPQFKLSQKQQEMLLRFFKSISAELEQFKEILVEKGFSAEDLNDITATINSEELSLTIHIPKPEIYQAFIDWLDEKLQLELDIKSVQAPALLKK